MSDDDEVVDISDDTQRLLDDLGAAIAAIDRLRGQRIDPGDHQKPFSLLLLEQAEETFDPDHTPYEVVGFAMWVAEHLDRERVAWLRNLLSAALAGPDASDELAEQAPACPRRSSRRRWWGRR